MKILINNIKMPIRHNTDDVIAAAREIVRSDCVSARNFSIWKQSLDARRKNNIHYVYSVAADCDKPIRGKSITVLESSDGFEIPVRTFCRVHSCSVGQSSADFGARRRC